MTFRGWVRLSMLAALAGACSSRTDSDSETHFVCSANEECRAKFGDGYGCVESSCERVVRTSSHADASVEPPSDSTISPLAPRDARTDGSQCAAVRFAGELIAQNVYVLLDESLDMGNLVSGSIGSWWTGAVDGIERFVFSSNAESVNMALKYFPVGISPDACIASRFEQPDVPFVTLPGTGGAIINSIGSRVTFGLASTGPALKAGIAHAKSTSQGTAGQEFKVVLITSGPPLDCDPKSSSELADLAASGLAATPPIRTYVIALDDSAAVFDPVAAAGGTNRAIAVTGGDVASAVHDAIVSIVTGVRCDISLPPMPDGGALDPALIQLSYGLLDGGAAPITRVDGVSDCATLTRDGWYFDDSGASKRAVLCPDLCDHPRSRRLDVLLGCR
jgi:hypothetical protein